MNLRQSLVRYFGVLDPAGSGRIQAGSQVQGFGMEPNRSHAYNSRENLFPGSSWIQDPALDPAAF